MKKDIFDKYVDTVIRRYHITREELFSKSKKSDIVDARQTLYYLCYNRPMQVNLINRYMAENGYETAHTTIMRGIIAMEQKMQDDFDYRNVISKIQNGISLTV